MDARVRSDTDLLLRARRLDSQALAQVYDQYSPGLYRYALRLLGDPSQAEDCVAETFSRFLGALRDGKGPRDHLQAYLYRIAHNWITDQFRRERAVEELDENIAASAQGPEEAASVRIQQAHLREAIRRLTPDQQQVVALKYLEGWENEQIALTLGKPVGAVKSLQHRALAALHKILDGKSL